MAEFPGVASVLNDGLGFLLQFFVDECEFGFMFLGFVVCGWMKQLDLPALLSEVLVLPLVVKALKFLLNGIKHHFINQQVIK